MCICDGKGELGEGLVCVCVKRPTPRSKLSRASGVGGALLFVGFVGGGVAL